MVPTLRYLSARHTLPRMRYMIAAALVLTACSTTSVPASDAAIGDAGPVDAWRSCSSCAVRSGGCDERGQYDYCWSGFHDPTMWCETHCVAGCADGIGPGCRQVAPGSIGDPICIGDAGIVCIDLTR